MRISSVSNINFGHSKKSREYLENRINELQEPEAQDYLIKYNDMLNSMEDKIKENEKIYGVHYKNSEFIDMFTNLKGAFYQQVASLFGNFDKYMDLENKYYKQSLKNSKDKEDNWREYVLDCIADYMPVAKLGKKPSEEEYMEAHGISADIYEPSREKREIGVNEDPFLEKIEPNEFSPKSLKDIMGMEKLKSDLIENIVIPIQNPEIARQDYLEYGKKMPSGILLYGPPGCGKTYIIEALSNELDTDVYLMNSANTGSSYINKTSINIKKVFEFVYNEGDKSKKPIFLFMDEMDAMTSNRDSESDTEDNKSVATLLKCIEDAKNHNVIVVGATNKYDLIDPAIRRRFDMKEFVGLPDENQRKQLIMNNLSKKPKGAKLLKKEDEIEYISKKLEGYSYHSINIISDAASENARKRQRADIEKQDFDKAIKETNEEIINEKEYMTDSKKKTKMGFSA